MTLAPKFHGFHVAQLANGVGRLDHFGVGSHEAVHVGPDLQLFGVESCGNDGCRVVATATTEVGGLACSDVLADEARHERNAWQVFKGFLHQCVGHFACQHTLPVFVFSLDEVS